MENDEPSSSPPSQPTGWRAWAKGLKREVQVLSLAIRDRRTPWYAKAVAVCVVAYALSPIDLIPDPIPVLGYLDDLIIVPLGVLVVRRLIPGPVMAECRERAASAPPARSALGWGGAVVIGLVWLAASIWLGRLVWRWWRHP